MKNSGRITAARRGQEIRTDNQPFSVERVIIAPDFVVRKTVLFIQKTMKAMMAVIITRKQRAAIKAHHNHDSSRAA